VRVKYGDFSPMMPDVAAPITIIGHLPIAASPAALIGYTASLLPLSIVAEPAAPMPGGLNGNSSDSGASNLSSR